MAEEQAKITKDLTDKFIKSVNSLEIDAAMAKYKIPTGVKVYSLRGVESIKPENAPKEKVSFSPEKASNELSNFISKSFTDIIDNSNYGKESVSSVLFLQVNELSDLSNLDNVKLDVKSGAEVIYVAGYKGDLNKEAVINEINKNNSAMPTVKSNKSFTVSRVKVFAFKKQGDKYVRAPERDVFYSNQ